jgi:DNA polymerase I
MTSPKNINRYMLVDGNALVHRGFHAIPSLSTKSGEITNAVYGFSLILLKAIKDIKPTHIACTFDLAGPTFRHKQYSEYKATRVKSAQELYDQIPRIKQIVRALNIPIFEKEGFEADDCLGTLASKICEHEKHNCDVVIVTGDLDTLQLVNKCVRVYTMKKGITDTVIYDEKSVRARYGLNSNQMIDYKALRGDPSDNIPGVKGIGEKGAGDLIKQFGSIEELYKKLHIEAEKFDAKFPISNFQFPNNFQFLNFKSRILNLLLSQEEQAKMSYDLSRIRLDVPLEINISKYDFDQSHQQEIFKLFAELEFRSLLAKLPSQQISQSANQPIDKALQNSSLVKEEEVAETPSLLKRGEGEFVQNYQLVDTAEKLENALKILSAYSEICIDTETTGLNSFEDKLVGLGLCGKVGEAFYVPADTLALSHDLKELLKNEKIKKIGHNIKFDYEVLEANGYKLSAISFDTMIASYLLNSSTRQHNLDALAFSELGYQMQSIEELIGKGKAQITMDKVELEKVSWYCCEDVDMTLRLKNIFAGELEKANLNKIFSEIEMPLVEVLSEMEKAGIRLDSAFLNRLSGEAEIEIKDLESSIYKLTGEEFNLNSPKQMKEVLFEKMKLEPIANKKNKSGLSTAAGELEKMLGQHPVIEKIMQYRELAKLQSTYLLALPELVSKKTGRIHTSYNQTIAATGRLSSTNPNLQNIPVRGEGMGSKIRQAFVAEKGYKLLSIDYSQIELRVAAHLSKDQKMLEVFQKGEDIHAKTAMEIFGVSKENITSDMRRDAKTINFGILYGVSSFGLSARIGEMSNFEAKEFIKKYFLAFPKVEEYIEQVKLQVNETGFVKNELGRIRKFPEIKSSQFFIRAAAERAAVNFPIQSLAADIIKVAMIKIGHELRTQNTVDSKQNTECRMLLQVHDELLFEVKEEKLEEWAGKLIPIMENAIKLSAPVKVEAKVGESWGEMKALTRIEQD